MNTALYNNWMTCEELNWCVNASSRSCGKSFSINLYIWKDEVIIMIVEMVRQVVWMTGVRLTSNQPIVSGLQDSYHPNSFYRKER